MVSKSLRIVVCCLITILSMQTSDLSRRYQIPHLILHANRADNKESHRDITIERTLDLLDTQEGFLNLAQEAGAEFVGQVFSAAQSGGLCLCCGSLGFALSDPSLQCVGLLAATLGAVHARNACAVQKKFDDKITNHIKLLQKHYTSEEIHAFLENRKEGLHEKYLEHLQKAFPLAPHKQKMI